ncbi:MAG: hypothetical protein ACREQZ_11285 [Woeseiaceae bacterium]
MLKYLGRLFSSTKAHLIEIARILDFDPDVLRRMRSVKDEECEAIFLSQIEGRCGGPVDWRGGPEDIYDILDPCLSSDERQCLPSVDSIEPEPPTRVVKVLNAHITKTPRALRALGSLGDFYIILLVPRDRLAEFDHVARYWAE